ncbi:MAG: hypothetical protein NUV67_04835 [archaeon]|nr:hypothetical protein [archaeon]
MAKRPIPSYTPRRSFGQKAKRAALAVGVTAGLLGTAAMGAGKLAESYKSSAPDSIRPAVERVANSYSDAKKSAAQKANAAGKKASQITAKTRTEVNGAIKSVGWQIFYRSLGAAVGAVTMSSFMGSKRKRISRTSADGSYASEHSHEGVSGKTRKYIVAGSAIGGAIVPPVALTAGVLRGAFQAWQGMSEKQKQGVLSAAQRAAQAARDARRR